jgi:Ca-activated chloride channel family protein
MRRTRFHVHHLLLSLFCLALPLFVTACGDQRPATRRTQTAQSGTAAVGNGESKPAENDRALTVDEDSPPPAAEPTPIAESKTPSKDLFSASPAPLAAAPADAAPAGAVPLSASNGTGLSAAVKKSGGTGDRFLASPGGNQRLGEGQGPGEGGDKFAHLTENSFLLVKDSPLSTFSIDVDTASYAKVRQYLQENHALPPRDAVRIEELVNYFDYAYTPPSDEHPFAVHLGAADCPWRPEHKLVRIGLKGREVPIDERPVTNLVFLIDTSGSMTAENRLPLVKRGLEMLASQLGENDRISMVVYAGAAGLVLPATSGDDHDVIRGALDRLQAGGSTNGGAGIHLAYDVARENFVNGGVNRVILCSDGDFNVGTTSTSELVQLAEKNAKSGVFLTVLGFGIGNHNDAMLEQISNKANGNYYFVDNESEARKVLVDQMTGTLTTIAKDVKIQVEFNPAKVASYRLVGYENRLLADRDFNDDKKDAGEIGAGHTVTALYEIKPVQQGNGPIDLNDSEIDDLKYQKPRELSPAAPTGELLTVKLRYKQPDGDKSTLLSVPLADVPQRFSEAPADLQFAGAVAMFGMLLRGSEHAGQARWEAVLEIASSTTADDRRGYRAEFVEMVKTAQGLAPAKMSATAEN